jgi:hypothetical protein
LNRDLSGTAQDGRVRKTALYLAAWFAAGVAAVLLAGAGLGMVGRQVTGSRPAPLSAEELREKVAATEDTATTSTTAITAPSTTTTSVTSPTASTTVAPPTDDGPAGASTTTTAPPTSAATTRSYDLVGGTATLRFSAAGVKLVAATPKAGFTVDVSGSHSNGVRVEFEGDEHESRLDGWWDGGPQDEVREED